MSIISLLRVCTAVVLDAIAQVWQAIYIATNYHNQLDEPVEYKHPAAFLAALLALTSTLVLLSPALASAGWMSCPGVTSNASTSTMELYPAGPACLRQTTATDPARVDATRCSGGLDVTFQDATGTNYDASALVYQCAGTGSAGTFTDCKLVPIDRDGDGMGDGLPLTGNEASLQFGLWGLAPDWYAFDITNGSSRTIELKAICR